MDRSCRERPWLRSQRLLVLDAQAMSRHAGQAQLGRKQVERCFRLSVAENRRLLAFRAAPRASSSEVLLWRRQRSRESPFRQGRADGVTSPREAAVLLARKQVSLNVLRSNRHRRRWVARRYESRVSVARVTSRRRDLARPVRRPVRHVVASLQVHRRLERRRSLALLRSRRARRLVQLAFREHPVRKRASDRQKRRHRRQSHLRLCGIGQRNSKPVDQVRSPSKHGR